MVLCNIDVYTQRATVGRVWPRKSGDCSMKRFLTAAGLALGLMVSGAQAVTIDLGFAIDESGSVSGNAQAGELGLLRGGLAAALNQIPSVGASDNPNTYRISVVSFAGSARVLIPPTVITDRSRALIQSTLRRAPRLSGSTNIASAIDLLTRTLCPGGCEAATTLFNIATDGANGGDPTVNANPAALAAGVDGISYEAIGGGLAAEDIAQFAFPGPAVVVRDLDELPNPTETSFVIELDNFSGFAAAVDAKVDLFVETTGGTGLPPIVAGGGGAGAPGQGVGAGGGAGGGAGAGGGVSQPAPIPVPAALPLLLAGLGALAFAGRARRRTA